MIYKRPYNTQKYQKKLKLLLTSYCPYACTFCHNEGQLDNSVNDSINPNQLNVYLPRLRKQFKEITLSGGEPLAYSEFGELLELLYQHSFDITLDTSGLNLQKYIDSFWKLKSLHISILTLNIESDLNNYNGDFKTKIENLRLVRRKYPLINICINVIVHDIVDLTNCFSDFQTLLENLVDKIKFIYEFKFLKTKLDSDYKDWGQRWEPLLVKIQEIGFKYISSNPREVEYSNYKNKTIELSEIPCFHHDKVFDNGLCFDNMDIVIDPKLNFRLCRWQDNIISIKSLETETIESIFASLTLQDSQTCPYKISNHPFISDSILKKYIFLKHNNWLTISEQTKEVINKQIEYNEISYFGREGIVAQFEKEFANYHLLPFSLSVSSGTMALYLALKSLDLKPNSEVITSIYSYPGAITALIEAGAKLVFCDIDPLDGNIDVNCLEKLISENTKAILITHMWGKPVNIKYISELCTNKSIKLIEDCSHAIGAEVNNQKTGTFGDIGCFSLQANKSVVSGEGGILITKSQEIYENAVSFSSLRNRMIDDIKVSNLKKYWETGLSLKYKIHPLGAAIALSYLRELDNINTARKINYHIIANILNNTQGIQFDFNRLDNTSRVFYTFKPILSEKLIPFRNEIVSNLIICGLDVKIPDNEPLNLTPFYNDFLKNNQILRDYPNAEKYYKRVISMPSFTTEPKELVEYYGYTIKRVIEQFN